MRLTAVDDHTHHGIRVMALKVRDTNATSYTTTQRRKALKRAMLRRMANVTGPMTFELAMGWECTCILVIAYANF